MRGEIATDHGGFGLMKEELVAHLRVAGHEVIEFGAHGLSQGDNYPDFVVPLARAVAAGMGMVERGWRSAAAASAHWSAQTRYQAFAPGWCMTTSRPVKGLRTTT